MIAHGTAWLDRGRQRWMQPGARRWLRPDAFRWALPDERKYDPNQPRVPAGSPDGGQWTSGGGSGSGSGLSKPSAQALPRVAVAGMPRIPPTRPPTGPARTAIAKTVATWLMEEGIRNVDRIARTSWLYHAMPSIVSYLDGPKTLEELHQRTLTSRAGYDVHHIVERDAARRDGYPLSRINARDNLVLVPRMRHWDINAWYQRINPDYDDMPPRDYLRGKDWDERRRVGLRALVDHGVLKP